MWSIAEAYKVPFSALTVLGENILMSCNSYLEMREHLTKVPDCAVYKTSCNYRSNLSRLSKHAIKEFLNAFISKILWLQ